LEVVTEIVPWNVESLGFKLSMNAQVPLRSATIAINASPGRSSGVLSSPQSTCWESGLEASRWGALSLFRTVIELPTETELAFGLTPALLRIRVRFDEA